LNASNLTSGTVPSAHIGGIYSNAVTFSNAMNSFTGSGAGLTSLNPANLTAGTAGISITGNAATATVAGNVTGTVAVANGGTGASTAATALTNLGAVAKAGDTMAGPLSVGSGTGPLIVTPANDTTTGTMVNQVAKLTGAPSAAVITSTTDTGGAVGIVVGGAGKSGNAQIAVGGVASCAFDGGTTAGHYVQISASVAGDCHDFGATYPTSGQVLGRVLTSNLGMGTYPVAVAAPEQRGFSGGGGGAGTVTSITAAGGLTASPLNPITTSGTISIATGGVTNAMLANSSVTVNTGTGLTGGGAVTLGGAPLTLSNTGVLTFNGRSGIVVPQSGDYTFSQISGSVASTQLAGTYTNGVTFSNAANSFTGNGAGLASVNAVTLSGFTFGAFPRLAIANTFTTGAQTIQTGAAATKGLIVQGAASQTANLQEWQDSTGATLASVSATGAVTASSFALSPGGPGKLLLTMLLGNAGGLNSTSGYLNMISNYVPPVNATAFTFNRCSWGATLAGQELSFRSAIRSPTGTGTVTTGNAFFLFPTSAGSETIYNENNDFFSLTAGQSYDFGMNFITTPAALNGGTCSTVVMVFSM
jgi:hypothetical protein